MKPVAHHSEAFASKGSSGSLWLLAACLAGMTVFGGAANLVEGLAPVVAMSILVTVAGAVGYAFVVIAARLIDEPGVDGGVEHGSDSETLRRRLSAAPADPRATQNAED